MFIPRHPTVLQECPSSDSCLPVKAIVGQDPSEQENESGSTNPLADWTRPGPHRYIGIWIVVGLIVVVFAFYLTCARRPRRFFRRHLRRKSQASEKQMQQVAEAFVAPSPLITKPEKARPKSGRSGQSIGFVGSRMVTEHSTHKYDVQSEWDVQRPNAQVSFLHAYLCRSSNSYRLACR